MRARSSAHSSVTSSTHASLGLTSPVTSSRLSAKSEISDMSIRMSDAPEQSTGASENICTERTRHLLSHTNSREKPTAVGEPPELPANPSMDRPSMVALVA